MNKLLIKLGDRIRSLRNAQRISQEKLAEMSGVDPKYIGLIERAQTNPSINTLSRIADSLGINLSELFSFSKSTNINETSIFEVANLIKEVDPKDIELVKNVLQEIVKWHKRGKN